MAAYDKITLDGTHGVYQMSVTSLDTLIRRVVLGDLPDTVSDLQTEIRQRSGDPNYTIHTVAEGLMILGEYEGYATN